MARLKLKKTAKNKIIIISLSIILAVIITNKLTNFIEESKYKKTYEYKLIELGYEKADAIILDKKLNNKNLDYLLTIDTNKDIVNLTKDKYFINKNLKRYLAFMDNNRELNMRSVIEHINVGRDKDFYQDTKKVDISKKELMLVNKYHHLNEDYVPENLVTVSQKYAWGEKGSQKCAKVTYDAFLKMWEVANNSGYYLMINSSYRDFEKQNNIFESYKKRYGIEYAEDYAAHPGYSEHQTGYALDIVDKNYTSKDTFTTSEAFNWMKDNAYKFGFILRYQEEKESVTGTNFESWHYRYVGTKVAKYIYENNITFDEYYAFFIEK